MKHRTELNLGTTYMRASSRSARSAALTLATVLAVLFATRLETRAAIIVDESFEVPDIATDTFQYNPTGSAWTFASQSGIIDGVGGGFAAPPAPGGSQIAFLQYFHVVGGAISQPFALGAAGTYQVTYFEAARLSGGGLETIPYEILLDATVIGSSAPVRGQPFTSRSFDFAAAAGAHTLTFRTAASATGDNTAFFDSVQIVPEPGTALLVCAGAGAFFAARRRRPRVSTQH